jgi:type II secretory pathway pseudopilin PulG
MKKEKSKYQDGLSLVELLTSFAIFGILSVLIMAIFTASVNTQTTILQNQSIMNETNFVLDYMGRVIRLAKYDTDGLCVSGGNNYYVSGSSLQFLSWDATVGAGGGYVCRKFSLSGNAIVEQFSTDNNASNFGNPIALTSGQVKVESLNFYITGNSRSDSIQPKITINFKMTPTGRRIEPAPEITIQTSLSQRNLDID